MSTKRRFPFSVHILRHAVILALLLCSSVVQGQGRRGVPETQSPAAVTNEDGVLPTGFPYRISAPRAWNGVAISDLDAVGPIDPLVRALLERGYAYVGTGRHPERMTRHDPLTELDAQVALLERLAAAYGEPRFTIQYGCSGGGFISLAMAETRASFIDGAVAFNARGTGGIAVANTWLDLPFVLKALLAPGSDLAVAPVESTSLPAAYDAWVPILARAQETPEGRARIALAVAVAQWPTWGAIGAPPAKPEAGNLASLQLAMFRSASDGLRNAITRRQLYDNPAGLASWNTGIDYAQFYRTGADADQQDVVRRLYDQAGLGAEGIGTDLARINAQPRIPVSAEGLRYWREPGRLLAGNVDVPVLHVHGLGDALLPPHLLSGYADAVERQGKQDLYRTAFLDAAGHCTTRPSEALAAIETVVQRLETGRWPDTTPDALNRRVTAYGPEPGRYVDATLTPFNRAFHPGSPSPSAR